MRRMIALLAAVVVSGVLPALASTTFPGYPVPSASIPPSPAASAWTSLADVGQAFANAHIAENADLCPGGVCQAGAQLLPDFFIWPLNYSSMTNSEKASFFINMERHSRGLLRFEGVDPAVEQVAQNWAQHLLDTGTSSHNSNAKAQIEAACAGCAGNLQNEVAENIYAETNVGVAEFSLERAIYYWMYQGDGPGQWANRRALLWSSLENDHGPADSEGFLGIGVATASHASGTGWQSWVVWNAIDTNANYPLTGVPGASTLISPSGTITTSIPVYMWNAVAGATHYYLWVNDATGTPIKTWITAAWAGCGAGTGVCLVTSESVPVAGNGQWWIQTWNSLGYGPWSSGMTFTVSTGVPPAATLIYPIGTIATEIPVYTWNAAADATWYYLWVNDATGTPIKTWISAATAGCPGGTGTCSVTSEGAPVSGNAQWWVQTWNSSGYGPWSSGMTFTVNPGAPPPVATLVSPSGLVGGTGFNPTYVWNAVSSATWYQLWVRAYNPYAPGPPPYWDHQIWYTAAQAGCAGGTGTCSVTPTSWGEGNADTVMPDSLTYEWWIQIWNPAGYGPWSQSLTYYTIGP